jgi:hypothetical protein
MRHLLWGIAPAVFGCLLAGCTPGYPDTAKVEGRVLLDGEPLMAGEVQFFADGGRFMATGPIHRDGTYRLTTFQLEDGAVLGPHKVAVQPPTDDRGSPLLIIPERFQNPETSGLEYEVKPGQNVINIPLDASGDAEDSPELAGPE